jgi:hypothetical protein
VWPPGTCTGAGEPAAGGATVEEEAERGPGARAGRPFVTPARSMDPRKRPTMMIAATAGLARPRRRERNPDVYTNGSEVGFG